MSDWTWRDFDLSGGTSRVLRRPAEGPAVVLLHGASGNAGSWRVLGPAFEGLDLWCPPLPGRVAGGHAARNTVTGLAAWFDELIEAAGLRAACHVGHSLGGAVLQQHALDHAAGAPLVLLASSARLRVSPPILSMVEALGPGQTLPMQFAFGPDSAPESVRRYCADTATVPPSAARADWAACHSFDVRARLGAIERRVLVLHGDVDALTPALFQAKLADALPNAERVEIEGAGHMLPWERPAETAAAIRRFVEG